MRRLGLLRLKSFAGSSTDLTWDSELYTSGDHAAVLSITAFQPSQEPATSAAEHGANAANSPARSAALGNGRQHSGQSGSGSDGGGGGGHSVLFGDARGDGVHVTVPTGAAGDAVVSRWQPHAGRCSLWHTLQTSLSCMFLVKAAG